MSIFPLNRKAQSTLEVAVILVAILLALLFMQVYVRRAISGKIKETADDIGTLYNPGGKTEINTRFALGDKAGRIPLPTNMIKINSTVNNSYVINIDGDDYQIKHTKTETNSHEELSGTEKAFFR